MKTNSQFWSYLAHLFLEWEDFEQTYRENENTHFMFNKFKKKCLLWDNVENYCRVGQATDDFNTVRYSATCF